MRKLFKEALDAEIAASASLAHGIGRFGRQPQHPDFVTVGQAAKMMGTSRRTMTRLSRLDGTATVAMKGDNRVRRKLPLRAVRQLVADKADSEAGWILARRLGVPSESICVVARILGIMALPAGHRQARVGRRLFSHSSATAFEARLRDRAGDVGYSDWPCIRVALAGFPDLAVAIAFAMGAVDEGTLSATRSVDAVGLAACLHADPHMLSSEVRRRWLAFLGEERDSEPLDTAEACALLACSPSMLARILAIGLLPPTDLRHPRFDPFELRAFRHMFCTVAEAAMRLHVAPAKAWEIFGKVDRAVVLALPGKGCLLDRGAVERVVEGRADARPR